MGNNKGEKLMRENTMTYKKDNAIMKHITQHANLKINLKHYLNETKALQE